MERTDIPTALIVSAFEKKWEEFSALDKEEMIAVGAKWLRHMIRVHGFRNWPERMQSIYLRKGPSDFMKPRDICRIIIFQLGNKMSVLCAGVWVLIRLALSKATNKDHRAKMEMIHIIRLYEAVVMKTDTFGYYDLKKGHFELTR